MSQVTTYRSNVIPPGVTETLTGNTGGAVGPDGSNNINVVGDGTTITVAGNPGTHTLTISAEGSIPDIFPANTGNAVPVAGVLNILGDGTTATTVGSGNTITISAINTGVVEQIDGNSGSATPSAGVITVKVDQTILQNYLDNSTVNFYASGSQNVLSFTDQYDCTGVGYRSLYSQNGAVGTGSNTAFGFATLSSLISGANNTAVGAETGFNLSRLAPGGCLDNTLMGFKTGLALTNANDNTFIGVAVGSRMTTGSYNTIIGQSIDATDPFVGGAGYNYTSSESSNIVIANAGVNGESNVMRLGTTGSGNAQVNSTYIAGINGITVSNQLMVVMNSSTEQLGTAIIPSSSISITGDTGGALTGNAFTFTGGTTGLTFAGSGTTETLGGKLIIANGGTDSSSFNTNGVVISGTASTSALTALSLTSGQVVIGGTSTPAAATLTAGTGIAISNGNNSITISATGTTTLTYTAVSSSPYVVLTTDDYLGVNSSGGAITVELPNAPVTGRVWSIKDSTGSAATHNITVTTVGGAVNIDGATSFVMNTAYEAVNVIFSGSAYEVF